MTHLCRRCLKTYGNQTKLTEQMSKVLEQEVCNISYVHPKSEDKIIHWYKNITAPMWIAAHVECMNVLLEAASENDSMEKSFLSKHVGIDLYIIKNPDDNYLNLGKSGYYKHFSEGCVDWFVNKMFEIETYTREIFENEVEICPIKIRDLDKTKSWLYEKDFTSTKRCSKF